MRIVRPPTLIYRTSLAATLGIGLGMIASRITPQGGWAGLLLFLLLMGFALAQPWRRWRLARRPFPPAWQTWIQQHIPFYHTLDPAGQQSFQRDVSFYMEEQSFEALEDVALTETLRLAVAAGAALLLHGRPDWELPAKRTILFYPDRFDDDYYDGNYANYDGMVHSQGPVILSAKAVIQDWSHPGTGHHVVLHELAHLIDFQQGVSAGRMGRASTTAQPSWKDLVTHEIRRIRLGRSLLRSYATTNETEFFAVAVENFFDRPHDLQNVHPNLYQALSDFFRLDPAGISGTQTHQVTGPSI